jgi:hypothetical protein
MMKTDRQMLNVQRFQIAMANRLKCLLITFITLSLMVGCASTGVPEGKVAEEIREGKKVVVLLRVVAQIGSQNYSAFEHDLVDDNICFGVGGFDTGGKLRRVEMQKFVSPESRENGWIYMVLEPGTHYVTIQPPRRTNLFAYMRRFDEPPLWQLNIPQGAKIIYGGTVKVEGYGDPLITGGMIMREIAYRSITGDDQEQASLLSAEYFSDLGVPKVSLLQTYDGGPLRFQAPE